MFEQVACFILIHVTALKHIGIVPWCNNENEVLITNSFHIRLSDFEKNIFDTILLSCIFL